MSKISSNYVKDPSANVPSFPISSEKNGVESVIETYRKGTEEVKNLLRNECQVIYECRHCNNIFRGLLSFLSHKRTSCQQLNSSEKTEAENRYLEQIVNKNADEIIGIVEQKTSKPPPLLRFNMASNLSKRTTTNKAVTNEVHTLPRKSTRLSAQAQTEKQEDGRQILDNIPLNLRMRNQLSEDRTFVVMPEGDRVTRCGKMQLSFRRRTAAILENPENGREITQEEAEIISRIPLSLQADYVCLRCLDEQCVRSGIPPFDSLILLASHLALNHPMADDEAAGYPYVCFLCNDMAFRSNSALKNHFDVLHGNIRKRCEEQHKQVRKSTNSVNSSSSRNSYSSADGQQSNLSTETCDEGFVEMSDRNENVADQNNVIKARLEAINKWRTQRSLLQDSVGHEGLTNLSTKAVPPPQMNRIPLITAKKSSLNTTTLAPRTPSNPKVNEAETGWSDGQQQFSTGTPRKIDGIISSVEAMEIDVALNSSAGQFNQQQDDSDSVDNDDHQADAEDASDDNDTGQQHFEDFADASDWSDGENGGISQMSVDPEPATKARMDEVVDLDNSSAQQQEQETHIPGLRRQRQPNRRFYNDQFVSPVDGEGLTKPADSPVTATIGSLLSLPPKTNEVPAFKRRATAMFQQQKIAPPIKKMAPLAVLTLSSLSKKPTLAATDTIPTTPLSSQCPQQQQFTNDTRPSTSESPTTSKTIYSAKRINITSQNKRSISAVHAQNRLQVGVIAAASAEKRRPSFTIPLIHMHFDGFVQKMLAKVANDSLPIAEADNESPTKHAKIPAKSVSDSSVQSVQLPHPTATATETTQVQTSDSTPNSSNVNSLKNDEEDCKRDGQQQQMESEREQPPPTPEDLSKIPVYITETQRDLYFTPLKRLFDPNKQADGNHQCSECGQQFSCKKDGQRHMVSHLRVIRLRCSLCQAGSFFCTDLRVHLMFRHCEMLHLAGDDFGLPGTAVPCMDKKKADSLMQIVDPYQPGRVVSTSGKIVSWSNPKAHFPDPIIERRILGV